MEMQQSSSLQNFDEPKTEILKKRLLKAAAAVASTASQIAISTQPVLSTLRAPTSSSMIVTTVQTPQSSMPITHNLVTHSLAPVKIHSTNNSYPLQLSTVHVPVQIPGSTSNINVPVQLSGASNSVPLQMAPVSLPLQVATTNVSGQMSAGDTMNMPLQISGNQNIQLTQAMSAMPILQNANQPLSNIIHVHMGSTGRSTENDVIMSSQGQLQLTESSMQVKMSSSSSQMQMGTNPTVVQIPSSSNNPIQLQLPNSGSSGTVQLRGSARPMPHVVYIQTPSGLKPVTSTEVISQATTSGNPPQIIVRRPVTSNSNIHLISNVNKTNIAPKMSTAKTSLLTPPQPIVITKPKEKMIPVTISSGQGKQAVAYLGAVKKATKTIPDNQSILINKQQSANSSNQKVFLKTLRPKIQNTKFILPVTLPATMASKGPIINLQIANGQIQNDPQGNSITVMRDLAMETSEMPPLQPLAKTANFNGKDNNNSSSVPQSPKSEKAFHISIPGSRAEPTGEQGEYTLSIPETNASMNDDIYTVSIEEEGGLSRENSFTLAIPEKGKSLLNKNLIDRNDLMPEPVAAPAILRRSNSDNIDRKSAQANLKRRISLCADNLSNKNSKLIVTESNVVVKIEEIPDNEVNDDHRVPSLFCDEKLEEAKVTLDSDVEEYKESKSESTSERNSHPIYYSRLDCFAKKDSSKRAKRSSLDSLEDDPPGLQWTNGVAHLQGSSLQFLTNEFGLIDMIDNNDQDDILMPSSKYQTPLKQRIDRGGREKKPASPEDLYCCDGCGCHGMAAEFITPNFCSVTCQSEVQKIAQKKQDRERNEIIKRRNKMRKLLLRKQLSDTDLMSDLDRIQQKQYDSNPLDTQLNEEIENEKYPWMCGKNGFSWMRYLDVCKAKAAPVKLFKDPFPYSRNNFKVGMRLEAIDPQHPALFCVVSVAEVQGYRLRLHFDEYSDAFDYWVNADCIDIFPPGWCEKNNRTLTPPGSYSASTFSWPMYLKQIRAIAAPKQLFAHVGTSIIKPNGFRIGMKLEAEDRKNELVCVATVADMLEHRLRINFDSWDEMYDYWVDSTSPYIHPVGWAEANNVSLTPPNFYKDPDQFSWDSYLEEMNATAAHARAFKTRAPAGYRPGMKLEVVDPRVPFLIRVATITAVAGHRVQVSFDGWGARLQTWLEDDSPDLHPVGWCLKTNHPLEPPLTVEEARISGPCGVGGCRGLGSVRGARKTHSAASACPYRPPSTSPRQDRLADPAGGTDHVLPRSRTKVVYDATVPAKPKSVTSSTPTSDAQRDKPARGRPPKHKRSAKIEASDEDSMSSVGGKRWRTLSPAQRTYSRAAQDARTDDDHARAQDERAYEARTQDERPYEARTKDERPYEARTQDERPYETRTHEEPTKERTHESAHGEKQAAPAHPAPPAVHCAKYIAELQLPSDPTVWTQSEVAALVGRIAGSMSGEAAVSARLSGAELLMASCQELVDCVKLRLGPAIKVYSAVRQLRDTLSR